MEYTNILIKTSLNLDQLAKQLKNLFNVADFNRTEFQKEQKRFGLNIGDGEYYLFEVLGLEIYLVNNKGSVSIGDEEYSFYLTITHKDEIQLNVYKPIVVYIANLLQKEGYDSRIANP